MKPLDLNRLRNDIYGPGDDNYGRDPLPWKKKDMKTKKPEMDLCVSCGIETEYPKHAHIDYRFHYVEGAGQLCKECYDKIYKVKDD